MGWTVLVPLKALPEAKSRLIGATDDLDAHLILVKAIRHDTLAAARAAEGVARVVLVLDQPADDQVGLDRPVADQVTYVQVVPGLNAGLAEAAAWAAGQWPADGRAVLLGDLPALTPPDLSAALAAAAVAAGQGRGRGYVPDRAGTGTTLLTAAAGLDLAPAFGPGSSARHAGSGAVLLPAGLGLRTDVDTAADLARAVDLGAGPATSAALAEFTPTRSSAVRLDTA